MQLVNVKWTAVTFGTRGGSFLASTDLFQSYEKKHELQRVISKYVDLGLSDNGIKNYEQRLK